MFPIKKLKSSLISTVWDLKKFPSDQTLITTHTYLAVLLLDLIESNNDMTVISFSSDRGSRWLDYDSWRTFLEELAWRKNLSINFLLDKIAAAGKPSSRN